MAVKTFDVTPLAQYLHRKFMSASSPSAAAGLSQFIVDMVTSQASVRSGTAVVKFAGVTYEFAPTAYPVMQTLDGGLATDLTLFCRQFLLALIAPILGQRAERDPHAVAEFTRSFVMKFFTGGTTGGAILDSGRWFISPHWLPIRPPNPELEASATVEDPVSRTLHLWAAETADGENAKKGATVAADPYFALLAVEGTTKVQTFAYTKHDIMNLNWSITLVHAGGSATDVITRAPTLTSAEYDTDTPAHWMSDAYEELLAQSGQTLAILQMPRACMYNRMLERIVKEGELFWFRGHTKDYRVSVADFATVQAVAGAPYDYKMSYLDMVRGIPMGSAKLTPALQASALGGIAGAYEFRDTVTRSAFQAVVLTPAVRSWIRSDPECPASLKWLADTVLPSISSAWLPSSTDVYVEMLRSKG